MLVIVVQKTKGLAHGHLVNSSWGQSHLKAQVLHTHSLPLFSWKGFGTITLC
jgi:hypothetical protein